MLDTRILHPLRARRPRRWSLRDALRALGGSRERSSTPPLPPQEPSFGPPPAPASDPPPAAEDEHEQFPAIVVKAQEEVRCRHALARMGYFRVRSQYLRHKLLRKPTFDGLEGEHLWPTMDFVQDWLKQEWTRIIGRTRFAFVMTLLATIVAGITFAGVAAFLG